MININVKKQELVFENRIYSVSTSKFGIGFKKGSLKTPIGNFIIAKKIGDNEPLYTIFKERKPVGVWNGKKLKEDLILTRILWLDGIDKKNLNTKNRFIYIHGTNQEQFIGVPASKGCIRMKNKDIKELFDIVNLGEKVFISS
jgi:lipoprotein-anchoring transpeptidase ErfK/SrfK